MQTSVLNNIRIIHYCTSSGNLKCFCSLAAVCYCPTMLSNRSHGARRSYFKEVFLLFVERVERQAFYCKLPEALSFEPGY